MPLVLALGPVGTYGHEAANRVIHTLPPDKSQSELAVERIILCGSHAEVFERITSEDCYCVVPIENSTAGLVEDTVRGFWLKQANIPVSVLGEVLIPIEHVLVMRHGEKLNAKTPVLSHPQALSQCREHLQRLSIEKTVATKSTAGAAELIVNDETWAHAAALVSLFAAERYKLNILADHMEDIRGNSTRFHILGRSFCPPAENCKTALIFWTQDKPRAMANAIWAISADDANLSSFHSIPLGISGMFAFYVEFDEHLGTAKGKDIVARLNTVTEDVLYLGSFPKEGGGQ